MDKKGSLSLGKQWKGMSPERKIKFLRDAIKKNLKEAQTNVAEDTFL